MRIFKNSLDKAIESSSVADSELYLEARYTWPAADVHGLDGDASRLINF